MKVRVGSGVWGVEWCGWVRVGGRVRVRVRVRVSENALHKRPPAPSSKTAATGPGSCVLSSLQHELEKETFVIHCANLLVQP